jgi:hypothetical protein
MGFSETLKEAFNAILHPKDGTTQSRSVSGALKFYYMVMIIPLILGIVLSYLLGGSTLGLVAVGTIALSLIIMIPLSILISGGIYYVIIGMLFKMFKADYSKVVTAFTYAVIPYLFLIWIITPLTSSLSSLAEIGIGLEIIAIIWSFITLLFALSNQLSISKLKAFGTLLLESIIVGIISFIIVFALGVSLLAPLLHTSSVA